MVKLNKIYTRTGDDGTTGLGTGERRSKHDLRIDAFGTVDETNAAIGMVRLYTGSADPLVDAMLGRIQNDLFDLGAIGRSAARFDFTKLEHVNGHTMRATSDHELVEAIAGLLPLLAEEKKWPASIDADLQARLITAMPGLKERARTLVELIDQAYYLYAQRPLVLEAKAEALIKEGKAVLAAIRPQLAALEEWSLASVEAVVRAQAEQSGLKLGQVAQPLRATLTGRSTSPGLFDVMAVLGKQACLDRIDDQL